LLGFPIAFTLVAMGVAFGYYAYWDPERMGLLKADGILEYLEAANKERFVCYQIEDPEALGDLEAMAELEGVDALFFGPGDYSVALGVPGQLQNEEIEKVRKQVARIARKHNKIAATVSGTETVGEYVDMGYNLLSVGADVLALSQYAERVLSAFDGI